MIASFTYGRIRARLTHLKGQQVPEVPVGNIKGVKNISINPLTGSVLLEYDPEQISIETIADFLEPLDPEGAATLRNPELLRPSSLFAKPIEVPIELLKPEDRPAVQERRHRERPRGSAEATAETINLTVGFLSVVFSAFWGSIRTHTLLGAGFGLMLGQHIWKHRRRLRPIHQMSWLEILGLDIPAFLRPKPLEPEEYQDYEVVDQSDQDESDQDESDQANPDDLPPGPLN
ncbi:MAG: heavy-metal-associated domain-containing protein [Deltaproteobacteria bacterium]|jgi:hypothetical protein|nr:heavy-metal-associated domain-containing protein [Deltaproteobacteria bacterium]